MAEKDLAEKTLEEFVDVFADIINLAFYDGRQVVKPEELQQGSKESYYKAGGEVRSQERDIAKYWMLGNVRIAMFGMENQTEYQKVMPLRVLSYDGAEYRHQLRVQERVRNENKKREEGGELLLPVNPLYPVVTLVLYFGYERRWNREFTNLKSCLEIPAELEPYVSDYRINVLEVAYLEDEQLAKLKSDFRIVAEYFVQLRKKKEGLVSDYDPNLQDIVHVNEFFLAMSAFTGDNTFERVYNDSIREANGGAVRMDLFIEEFKAKIRDAEAREEQERVRADAEKDRADAAETRADAAETRVQELEAELAALKAQRA